MRARAPLLPRRARAAHTLMGRLRSALRAPFQTAALASQATCANGRETGAERRERPGGLVRPGEHYKRVAPEAPSRRKQTSWVGRARLGASLLRCHSSARVGESAGLLLELLLLGSAPSISRTRLGAARRGSPHDGRGNAEHGGWCRARSGGGGGAACGRLWSSPWGKSFLRALLWSTTTAQPLRCAHCPRSALLQCQCCWPLFGSPLSHPCCH